MSLLVNTHSNIATNIQACCMEGVCSIMYPSSVVWFRDLEPLERDLESAKNLVQSQEYVNRSKARIRTLSVSEWNKLTLDCELERAKSRMFE